MDQTLFLISLQGLQKNGNVSFHVLRDENMIVFQLP